MRALSFFASGFGVLWLIFFVILAWSAATGSVARRREQTAVNDADSPPVSTLERAHQQRQLLKQAGDLPVLSAHESQLQWSGAALYFVWAVAFANRPQHLFHALVIMHILFNSKGKWASLSSTFKYDGNKMYPVALLFGFRLFGLLDNSLHYRYASSGLSAAARILIFLHETDAKLGHSAHMAFVYAAAVVDVWAQVHSGSGMPPELLWALLCGAVYVMCDPWSGLREKQIKQLINAAWTKFEDRAFPDRVAEYVTVTDVRLYFNFSHYAVHRMFSTVSVVCELVLLSSALR